MHATHESTDGDNSGCTGVIVNDDHSEKVKEVSDVVAKV
jgi:D-aminopeptidase